MEKFKDFRKSGAFRLSSGIDVTGELSLHGGGTSLDLFSRLSQVVAANPVHRHTNGRFVERPLARGCPPPRPARV